MLKKIDRYIAGKFLKTFAFTVLIFSLVTLIIDFSEKIERFIESEISRYEIIFEYFPTFLMFILGLLWPILTLIAVIFFTSRMAGNSEIISILNAGVSFRRLLRPYLAAATLLFTLYLLAVHFFVPWSNAKRLEIDRTYFSRSQDQGQTRNVHLFVSPDTKVYINFFRKRDSTARDFRLEQFRDNQLVYLLKARHAEWVGYPDKWQLHNYEVRTFDGDRETFKSGLGQKMDTTINLQPDDFVDYKEGQQSLATPELWAYIRKQRARGSGNVRKYEIELARRSAEPFTIYILTLIGVAVASRKVRGGMGIHLASGMFMGALYVFISRFAATITQGSSLPVLLGMWMPNILFFLLALYFISRAQR
ncbi:MAG: LptF/LptG family permease [Saprospiraceae bacterium]